MDFLLTYELWFWTAFINPFLIKWEFYILFDSLLKCFTYVTTLLIINLYLKQTSINALVFALKYFLLIALLIFVRGGIPRYRYDFLTKIGWIKLLSLTLSFFIIFYYLLLLY